MAKKRTMEVLKMSWYSLPGQQVRAVLVAAHGEATVRIAEKVAAKLAAMDCRYAFDIFTIILVIAVIVNIIRAIQFCIEHRKAAKVRAILQDPGPVRRRQMRSILKETRRLDQHKNFKGGDDFDDLGEAALGQVAQELTVQDVQDLMDEAGQTK